MMFLEFRYQVAVAVVFATALVVALIDFVRWVANKPLTDTDRRCGEVDEELRRNGQ